LELIINYEKGNWEHVNELIEKIGLDEEFVSSCYIEAIENLQILNNLVP
jgi:c-di-GMP-related signal transduction protein